MTLNDLKEKRIHFIGVGGIGMSGIAQLLAQQGYLVTGSDLSLNENTERLEKIGVQVTKGHTSLSVEGKDVIVVSTGIEEDNPELREARQRGLPILHRAEMLALLMEGHKTIAISGTHGKTTSTALMGWVLEVAGLDPTIINGGIMNAWESNVKAGNGSWCIAEADESDGSFIRLPRQVALVTNIDAEHMDYYGSSKKLHEAFEIFTTRLSPGGVAILGIDHAQVYALWQRIKVKQRCITYGLHPEADVRGHNVRLGSKGSFFELIKERRSLSLSLPLHGHHNILNALGVAATAFECGVKEEVIQKAFASFEGVQRRFTCVGEWQGITIIDDYAHHPVEIRATLAAAKKASEGRVIAVLEPHRYSRLAHHFNDFTTCCEDADVIIVLPVYGAREIPREGINHIVLAEGMKGEVYRCDGPENLPQLVQEVAQSGDMVVCLGAGSISRLARGLPFQLNQSYELRCM